MFIVLTLALKAQTNGSPLPIANDKVIFLENNGAVSVEAEYFYRQSKSQKRQWYITADYKETKLKASNNAI
ncbi:hypothetical protein JCM19294_1650 [Nonlabens tegetincola]|uniref:Uncharacterized protein n=1 Tax=Nonlabens tegetincola TaxID=323273 RepID=A0A090Q8G7_9FLAO|nr:hypothetical protein JCM19294_1650 [Nonlabens tegetincola]